MYYRYYNEKLKEMTDREFIDAAKGLRLRAMNVALWYKLETDEAEDIAQDAMIKLWSLKDSLYDVGHTNGLLNIMVRHLCIDFLKHKKALSVGILDAERDEWMLGGDRTAPPPDAELEDAENELWLRQKLKQLPSSEYQVLHLRQVEKKANDEIAEILGIEVTSVATLLSRARKRMFEEIKKRK